MHSSFRFISLFFLSTLTTFAVAQEDRLLSIVENELKREMAEFSKVGEPPYFLSYRINDVQTAVVTSSFGSLTASQNDRFRILVTDIKVGDYKFDNSHPINSFEDIDVPTYGGWGGESVELPQDDQPEAIKLMLWQQTQDSYRSALNMYKALKNSPQTGRDENVDDFSRENPSVHVDPPQGDFAAFFKNEDWTERIKKYTAPFLSSPEIIEAEATLEAGVERKYFVSSEGSRIAQNRTYAYLNIQGSVRAEDGDVVPLHKSYFAFSPADLPTDEQILKDVAAMVAKLELLRIAPVAEPYTGPAILYAHAAGVFFHEIFGHRVEGHRLKDISDGQTFKGKVSEEVLPKSLSVVFDPTLSHFEGQALNGFYRFDDEGVVAQRVKVVDNGVLKTFLMSRTPIENISRSNGHGRAQAGTEAVSRQSNLIIENARTMSMAELRKMLISECKKQKKQYGYMFMDVVGGFTTTNRFMPNAFNIFPTEVYRIYVDGRPDELVRGVDLIGTPLAMFAEIKAADDKREVFTGFCGAESGSVPVTAISPSLFVKRIETQKKPLTQIEKPILDRPAGGN